MKQFLDELRTFISFRTVGEDTTTKRKCLEWIEKTFLSQSGLPVTRGEVGGAPYVFYRHPAPKMLWFGHTDVVPGSDDQFTIRQEGDRICGRGVKDMKGADLAFLSAYREACAAGSVPPVSVLLTSDEENEGRTPPALLDQGLLGDVPVAFTPDTGETDGIVNELKGLLWVWLIAEGSSGHGAVPWKSDNPVPRLLRAIELFRGHFPMRPETEWAVTLTPTQLEGSDAPNRIPSEARALLDVRYPPTVWKNPDEAFQALRRLLPECCRLEIRHRASPIFCDPAHPMLQHIKRIGEDVTGTSVPLVRECGSSDARAFTARGIPAFLYGPLGGDLHGANEWVSLKSLEQHVEINRRVLREL